MNTQNFSHFVQTNNNMLIILYLHRINTQKTGKKNLMILIKKMFQAYRWHNKPNDFSLRLIFNIRTQYF
jgi:hypothetical protein